jgi:hypothetical protein
LSPKPCGTSLVDGKNPGKIVFCTLPGRNPGR